MQRGVLVSSTSRSRAVTGDYYDPVPLSLAVGKHAHVGWQRTYASLLGLLDCAIIVLTLLWAVIFRDIAHGAWAELIIAGLFVTAWLSLLAFDGAYDVRFLGSGTREYKAVARASFKCAGLSAIVVMMTGHGADRAALVLASGSAFLLLGRALARRVLARARRANAFVFRVLAVGDADQVTQLISSLRRDPQPGLVVVGACSPMSLDCSMLDVPVVEVGLDGARQAAESVRADLVVLTPSAAFDHDAVRELGWSLEGSGIDLVLAPPLTDVAGPRLRVHPVAGVPLIYVDAPDLGLARSVIKGTIDRLVAALGLVAVLPVMVVIGVLIKLDSPGPVLFAQPRVGKDGRVFRFWKFRSMTVGADTLARSLAAHNESDGLLFKIRTDPRVTSVGKWLRRWSLDELPQLVNVLKGDMSLVGPRPLPVLPQSFRGPERRRMLVKPGITGMWQVSGRSDTNWAEAVRLDLYYVENWSPWLDLVILWKTIAAVFEKRGAY